MKRFKLRARLASFVFLSFVASAMVGCKSGPPKPRPMPVGLVIRPVGEASRMTIQVYVGGSGFDKTLRDTPVDSLLNDWRSSPPRSSEFVTFPLGAEATTLGLKDPHWTYWRGPLNADHLVIIADLPRHMMRSDGARRVAIPLDRALWKHLKGKPVNVEISEKEVRLLDNPGP